MKIQPFRLERYFARHEFNTPHLMCCSDCESWTIADLLALEPGCMERFHTLRLGYTESPGHPDLRREIANQYSNIAPEQVLVHAGAEEAIFNFMNVLLDAGDHAIVHAPCYQSLAQIARAIGCEVSEWAGDPAHGFRLDLDVLESLLTARTRLVVINFPHNPTGCLADRPFMEELVRLSRKRGFVIFSDEVYRGLEYDSRDTLPALCELDECGVSLGVMSKSCGLAGLRIGWIATRNADLYNRLAAFKDYTTICNSAPSEFLAALALRHRDALIDRNLEIIRRNLEKLDEFFGRHAGFFDWQKPKAGPIAFPRLLGIDVVRFCRDLREQQGVLLLPGTLFAPGSNNFRIGFGRIDMPSGLDRLDHFMKTVRHSRAGSR